MLTKEEMAAIKKRNECSMCRDAGIDALLDNVGELEAALSGIPRDSMGRVMLPGCTVVMDSIAKAKSEFTVCVIHKDKFAVCHAVYSSFSYFDLADGKLFTITRNSDGSEVK